MRVKCLTLEHNTKASRDERTNHKATALPFKEVVRLFNKVRAPEHGLSLKLLLKGGTYLLA